MADEMPVFTNTAPLVNQFDFGAHLRASGRGVMDILQKANWERSRACDPDFDHNPKEGRGFPLIELSHPDGRTVKLNAPYIRTFDGKKEIVGLDDIKQYMKRGFRCPEVEVMGLETGDETSRLARLERQLYLMTEKLEALERKK